MICMVVCANTKRSGQLSSCFVSLRFFKSRFVSFRFCLSRLFSSTWMSAKTKTQTNAPDLLVYLSQCRCLAQWQFENRWPTRKSWHNFLSWPFSRLLPKLIINLAALQFISGCREPLPNEFSWQQQHQQQREHGNCLLEWSSSRNFSAQRSE